MRTRLFALLFMLSTLASLLGGCGASTGANATTPISAAAALGKLIFQDTNLSASGQMSCQSCHDPNNGHGSPFLTPVAMGGALGNLPGLRNPPAIRYLKYNGAFTIAADGTPSGGFFWDGRVNSLMDQAKGPFLNPVEMANNAPTDVIQKIRMASYAGQFKQVFGPAILDIGNEAQAFNLLAYALERYQVESPEFAPFTSKFDAVMQGKANFSDMQARGFALFNNPTNSAPSALDTQTNIYTVSHAGLTTRTDLCGRFKVPSLRNVQTRRYADRDLHGLQSQKQCQYARSSLQQNIRSRSCTQCA